MRRSLLDQPHGSEDIQALRRIIAQLADHCGINLTDSATLGRLLDGDFSDGPTPLGGHQDRRDLSAMLTLLFRLEASSSEDLGITGLRRLWHEHAKILARFRVGQLIAG